MPLNNIGLDGRNLGPTGIGRYTQELVRALSAAYPKLNWHLVVDQNKPLFLDESLQKKQNIFIHPTTASYYSWAEQTRLAAEIDTLGLDLIHFTNFNTPRRLKTPMVTTVHDLTLLFFPGRRMWPGKRWFYQQVLAATIKQSRQIITASQDAKCDILQFAKDKNLSLAASKIHLVPHGVSEVFSQKVAKKQTEQALIDLNIVNPYFLLVGAQLAHKNVHRVMAAFALVMTADWAKNYKLVIAGNRTRPAPHIDRVLKQHPQLKERLMFVGSITDNSLRALYHGATALIFASQKEGFGLPIIEAFTCGCPVIASKQSSLPEVGGQGAWYVDANQPKSIAKAMKQIISQPVLVAKKVKTGLTISKRYSWQLAAKQTFNVYQKAV